MPLDLVCPAGSVVALKAAVDTAPTRSTWGSATTPTRRLPRPQFRRGAGRRRPALRYAHDRGRKVLLALNTYPQPGRWQRWTGAVEDGGTPDLTITASARDFLLLLARREDPDTLFFSRRLVSEGDTEFGLVVKNACILIAAVQGLAFRWILSDHRFDLAEQADAVITTFIEGWAPRS